jgi:MFS family permease
VLAASAALWHFWVSSILLAGVGVTFGITPALVTDLVPQESLGTALARLGAAPTIGGIIGFSLTGYAIKAFGMTGVSIGAALLTLIAVALLVQVQRIGQPALA